MVALAVHLREIGHRATLCAPPGFDDVIGGHGLSYVTVGHDLRQGPKKVAGGAAGTVAAQFEILREAADGCDAVVGCAAMQIAARSIAEKLGIPYLYAAYAPVGLPSSELSPPPVYGPPRPKGVDTAAKWEADAQWWNETWRDGLNAQRAAIGLAPVPDVRGHVITDRPMLAADPTLAPWPSTPELAVVQTGAWLMPDLRPLSADLEAFLDAGAPPVLFGFGSILRPRASGATMLAAARAVGHRAIVLRGWAGIGADDDGHDWLSVGETNLQALLPRVVAVVHHGGSGTTLQAMQAGTPQVIVAHHYDQPYYAERVTALGIGTTPASQEPSAQSLAEALDHVLGATVRARAQELAPAVRTDGTAVAAAHLLGR